MLALTQGLLKVAGRTSSLLALNGANGSTSFVDQLDRAWAGAGNAQISTAQSRFGGSSLLLDGAGDWIQTTQNLAPFRFGTGDFTVEGFFRTSDSDAALVDHYAGNIANSWQFYMDASGRPQWFSSNGSGAVLIAGSTLAMNNLAWRHGAACRVNGVLRLFVDGVLGASVADTRNYNGSGVSILSIGAQVFQRNAAYDYSGHIGPVRISNFGRYPAAFTPPADPFSLD